MPRRLFHATLLHRTPFGGHRPPRRNLRFHPAALARHPMVLAGLFYLVFLIWQAPPSLLFSLLATRPALAAVQPLQPEGTLWRGHAAQLALPGHTLPQPAWELSLPSLLTGSPRLRVSAGTETGFPHARGLLTLNLWNDTLRVGELEAHLPLSLLLAGVSIPAPFALEGRVRIRQGEGEFGKQRPLRLQGEVELETLRLVQDPELRFGSFGVRFDTDAQGIHATANDRGGPLHLTLRWDLTPDGAYAVHGQVKNTDPKLQRPINLLKYLGRTDPDGTVHFRWSGKIP